MYEIRCPKCGEVFQVEKAAYAEIVDQVRNEQFSADLDARVKAVREKMEAEQEAAHKALESLKAEEAAQPKEAPVEAAPVKPVKPKRYYRP